ncbi:MAG: GTPase Era [Clostridiales bacterium]|nr:GTPase Era [Clostridiales bacterium]
MGFKSGFISIVGRPNVGKSTLLNKLAGEKISIISNKPQTTRNNLRAIITEEDYQVIFIDTPGIHKPQNRLGEYMVAEAFETLEGADGIVYMYDSLKSEIGMGDKYILEHLPNGKNIPAFLILNKIDLIPKENLLGLIEQLSKLHDFADIIPISAAKGDGIDVLLNEIKRILPEGPKYFSEDLITDTSIREICTEIIREKILKFTDEEIPHGTGVEIISYDEVSKGKNKGLIHIESTIYCEKASHKGIIIGKDGTMLKKIGIAARRDIEKLVDARVNLKLWVKVKDDWRNDNFMLKELGFTKKK